MYWNYISISKHNTTKQNCWGMVMVLVERGGTDGSDLILLQYIKVRGITGGGRYFKK